MLNTKKLVWRLLLAVAVCAGLLVATEGVLRILEIPNQPCGWRRVVDYPPDQVNQLGHRGRPIQYNPGDFVVLIVGDSQVEAAASPFEQMPEVLLEQNLRRFVPNARVFSIASLAWGNDQQLLSLREYYASGASATLVILWQTIGNDIWDNTFITRAMGKRGILKPTFRLKRNSLVEPSVQRLGDPPRIPRFLQLLHYSGVVDLDVLWGLRLPAPSRPLSEAERAPLLHLPVLDTEERMDRDKSHWSIWLVPESPRVTYGIKMTRALALEMDRLVRKNGGVFVVFDVDRHTPNGLAEAPYASTDLNLRQNLVRYNGQYYHANTARVKPVRERINEGLLHIVVPITVSNHTVSAEDAHLNVRGNSQVMGDLVQNLSSMGLLPSKPPR